jgi:hypothetical protein
MSGITSAAGGVDAPTSEPHFETIPAWRIARLRAALRDAMQRGRDGAEDNDEQNHRALKRRFAVGRHLAVKAATTPRTKTTRKGRRFPLTKQIAIWRAILATRPQAWQQGDKAPFGRIAEAHRMAAQACRNLDLAPPRYRTVYILWHKGVPSVEVMQALERSTSAG